MSQMIIIGGQYANTSYDSCDVPNIQGQHNMNLGMQDPDEVVWYQLLPNVTSYAVPPNVTSVIGGG
jgi:hypothetical protein